MKKVVLLFFCIIFFRCGSDDSAISDGQPNNPIPEETILLIKTEEFDENEVLESTKNYTYDNSDKLIRASEIAVNGYESITNYIYSNDNLIKSIESDNSSPGDNIYEYTYDNGLMVYRKQTTVHGEVWEHIYSYYPSGLLHIMQSPDGAEKRTYFYDSNDRLSRTVYINPGSPEREIFYEFDIRNNIIKITSSSSITTYSYVYNSDNLPDIRTEKRNGTVFEIQKYYYN